MNVGSGAETMIHTCRLPCTKPVFSPDATLIAVHSEEEVWIYNTVTTGKSWAVSLATGHQIRMAISSSNKFWAVAQKDCVYLYDLNKNGHRHDLSGLGSLMPHVPGIKDITNLVFSPDDSILALTKARGLTTLWDIKAQAPICAVHQLISWANPIAVSRDGRNIVTADGTHIRVFDASTGKLVKKYDESLDGSDGVSCVAVFSPDGNKIITGYSRGEIRIHTWTDSFDPDVAFADMKSAAKLS